jgi:hypothetical protein
MLGESLYVSILGYISVKVMNKHKISNNKVDHLHSVTQPTTYYPTTMVNKNDDDENHEDWRMEKWMAHIEAAAETLYNCKNPRDVDLYECALQKLYPVPYNMGQDATYEVRREGLDKLFEELKNTGRMLVAFRKWENPAEWH